MNTERGARNRFDVGVMVAIAGLTITVISGGAAVFVSVGDFAARLEAIETTLARVPPPVYITPGAASEISALKARQDMDDKLRAELDARLARIEAAQTQILTEVRRR